MWELFFIVTSGSGNFLKLSQPILQLFFIVTSGSGNFSKRFLSASSRLANPGGESRTGTRTCMPGEVPPKQDRPFFIKGATSRTVSLPCSILRRSVLRQDPAPEISSGSGANARQNSSYKRVFWQKHDFKSEKTVQFSGFVRTAKNRQSCRLSGNPARPGGPLRPKLKGGPVRGWKKQVFSKKC